MRANLFLVGAQRCGTTAWHRYLGSHPQIAAVRGKEPHFFMTDYPVGRHITRQEDYHRLFDKPARYWLDASTGHLFSAEAAANIRAYNPAARILLLLRPPLDFLPSLHALSLMRLYEDQPQFSAAWALQDRRVAGELKLPARCPHAVLLHYSHLAKLGEQLRRYTEIFPAANIRVVHFHQWTAAPQAVYRALLNWLDLPDDGRSDFPRINESRMPRSRLLERVLTTKQPAVQKARNLAGRLLNPLRPDFLAHLRQRNLVAHKPPPIPAALAAEISALLAEDQALLARLAAPLNLLEPATSCVPPPPVHPRWG